ncbi:hypothetical protein ACKFKG_30110 [Phormidesmis sp. 146-35]
MFFLAYYLHWGHAEVMDLTTDERWAYVRLMSEQLEREREELEKTKRR